MKTPRTAEGGKRTWGIIGLALFAAFDIALVGAAYVHGHPDVQGTADPIPTYSSPATATPRPVSLSLRPTATGSATSSSENR